MKIVFTGGGTAGHVMVNQILISYLQNQGKACQMVYVGSYKGMEREWIENIPDIPFYGISTGKLRRYFSFKNFTDCFRVVWGFFQALRILIKEKPDRVYSGGGFVIVPVVWAARLLRIPVYLRETDFSVGLANRLCLSSAKKVFTTFPNTKVNHKNVAFPGMIIRPKLLDVYNREHLGLKNNLPICLVIGGSQGSKAINALIWESMEALSNEYLVIHICGRRNLNRSIPDSEYYRQIEFTHEMEKYLSISDVVISRCGSNVISECLVLGKRMVCIPMNSKSSRGEQIQNAEFIIENGNAALLLEEALTTKALLESLKRVMAQKEKTPYKVTKGQMIQRICTHVEELTQSI